MNTRNPRWALIVSNLLSPPAVWAVAAVPIAFHSANSQQEAITWVMIYDGLVCFLPAVYIAWAVLRGQITDIHLRVRRERIRPFVVSIFFAILTWIILMSIDASAIMRVFAVSTIVQLALMLLITLVWQISIHMMSISGMMVVVGALFGLESSLLLLPLVLAVGAARIALRRHTLAQVVAGLLIGALSVALILVVSSLLEPGIFGT